MYLRRVCHANSEILVCYAKPVNLLQITATPIARTPVPFYPKTNNKNEAMPVQFSTLFLISLFSTALALSGCVGSDNSSAPKKPNQPSSDNNTKPGDKNPGVPNPDPSNPDPSSPGGNNETGGNNGSGTTTDPVSCEAPDISLPDTSFNNVDDVTKYNIDDYAETTTDPDDLEGTWVIIGKEQVDANALDDSSLHFFQKYFLVIKNVGSDKYDVANCAGEVIAEDIIEALDCRDRDDNVVTCPPGSDTGKVGTKYEEFTGFLTTDKEVDNKINLPFFGYQGVDFDVQTKKYLTAENNRFIAKKIDNNTNTLGSLAITSIKDHTITKNVYLLELTPAELLMHAASAEDRASIIKDLRPAHFPAKVTFVLSTNDVSSPTPQSLYSSDDITCISQQVLFSRACKASKTNTLAIVSLTSKTSHHLMSAMVDEQNTADNKVAISNQTVIAGENRGNVGDIAGTVLDKHEKLFFTANQTEFAKNLSFNFTTNTVSKSYEAKFIKLCSPTESDYNAYNGGDCVIDSGNDPRKLYKVLIETVYTADQSELDVNITPGSLVN